MGELQWGFPLVNKDTVSGWSLICRTRINFGHFDVKKNEAKETAKSAKSLVFVQGVYEWYVQSVFLWTISVKNYYLWATLVRLIVGNGKWQPVENLPVLW